MKVFEVVLENSKSKEKLRYEVKAREFATAASEAYLKRHNLSRKNDSDWYIISLSERG
jgi:hypothetical protein